VTVEIPDLSEFVLHKVVENVDWDGVPVPQLRATFHRRREGDRIVSVGVYELAGHPIFIAWGYVGEEHCRYTVVRRPDGGWDRPRPGCPPVRVLCGPDDDTVTLVVQTTVGEIHHDGTRVTPLADTVGSS